MKENKELANMYYDFVEKYGFNYEESQEFQKFLKNNFSENLNKQFYDLIKIVFKNETMYFVIKDTKKNSLEVINDMLKTQKQSMRLLSNLENTFDDSSFYIAKIENLDYISNNFVNKDQLSIMIDKYFEWDSEFKMKDYFNLYLKYKELCNNLEIHIKTFE